ncbi:alpha/beta fold hydrolase [Solimonas terrae]|uniref:Alpha/beta hydrolase n=1 Tax=Solimonas terrae TaxID=1396819 RepID=A0A6M2BTQ4_9GAMM|nr:alpha/beta hydrolase [Solimonas terrae]NGY05493.1 alpha/beta hydrolase [Solimonas terrae]
MSLTRWRETGGEFRFRAHRIFIRDTGSGDEAVLLLHGFPTASWDFEAMWPGLARRFARVVTLDLLGFGFSDKPPGYRYSVREQADLVAELLAALGIRRVQLLAHDYGACVAQELLARMRQGGRGDPPDIVPITSCVLLNAALFPEAYHPSLMQRLLLGPLAPLYLQLAGPRRFGRVFSALFGAQTKPGLIELHDYWTLIGQQRGRRALGALFRFVEERRSQRARWLQALAGARIPLRLICGSDDPVAGREMAERYRQLIDQADIVLLDGIGHFPHVEAPDRTLRAFLAFHDALA